MAAQFVGLHMRVALRQPAGIVLTGTVRDVVAGISLTLTNGMFDPRSQHMYIQPTGLLTFCSLCSGYKGLAS